MSVKVKSIEIERYEFSSLECYFELVFSEALENDLVYLEAWINIGEYSKGVSFGYHKSVRFTDFYFGWLCSATFREATMDYFSFVKADLRYADFSHVVLASANLTDTLCIRTDFRKANLMQADIKMSLFDHVLLQGANLTGMKGIEEADIKSINLGTVEEPIMLEGEQAKHWMLEQANLHS